MGRDSKKVPFICDKCHKTRWFHIFPTKRDCTCPDGVMEIYYQDNYEQISEVTVCHTCVNNFEGGGEKCNYCVRI